MKTIKHFLLIAITFGSVLFISSCNKDDDDSSSGVNKIFTVENAAYVEEALPQGAIDVITNLNVNKSAINGGSSLITFSSAEQMTTVYVGIPGETGYFRCSVTPTQTLSGYDYQLLLLLCQELEKLNFKIYISGVTVSGNTTKAVTSEEVSVIEVGTGKLQVSLSWDQKDDVDLHLFEPDGTEISYANPFSFDGDANQIEFNFYCFLIKKYTNNSTTGLSYLNQGDWELIYQYKMEIPVTVDEDEEWEKYIKNNNIKVYGELDLDSNAACFIDGVNNENITYQTNIKPGTYTIAVDLYSKCNINPGAKYSVTVNYNGKPITISTKQVGQFDKDYLGSYDDPDQYIIIGEFTIDGNTIRSSNPVQINPVQKKIHDRLFRKK